MDDQEAGQTWATIAEAGDALGVSADTIRRRIKSGALPSRREATAQGFRWLVALPPETGPDAPESPRTHGTPHPVSQSLALLPTPETAQLIATLRHELELRNREIAKLHDVIATQAQAIAALPAAVVSPPGPESGGLHDRGAGPEPVAAARDATSSGQPAPAGILEHLRRWFLGR